MISQGIARVGDRVQTMPATDIEPRKGTIKGVLPTQAGQVMPWLRVLFDGDEYPTPLPGDMLELTGEPETPPLTPNGFDIGKRVRVLTGMPQAGDIGTMGGRVAGYTPSQDGEGWWIKVSFDDGLQGEFLPCQLQVMDSVYEPPPPRPVRPAPPEPDEPAEPTLMAVNDLRRRAIRLTARISGVVYRNVDGTDLEEEARVDLITDLAEEILDGDWE